jgi:hypothetical protein
MESNFYKSAFSIGFQQFFAFLTVQGLLRDSTKVIALHMGKSYLGADFQEKGAVAQLGERLVRNEEVVGSIPISSTGGQVLRNRK